MAKPLHTPSRYSIARAYAKTTQDEWALTEEEYAGFVSRPCSFCDGALSPNGVGLALRRRYAGYTTANVVPACRPCLRLLNHHKLTPAEVSQRRRAVKKLLGQT